MTFSDSDLERLKNAVKNYDLTGQPTLEIRPRELLALLARMEAHEALEPFIIDCLNWEEDEVKPKKWWDDFGKAHEAWRKSCREVGK